MNAEPDISPASTAPASTAPAIGLNQVGKVYRFYRRPFDRLRELFAGKGNVLHTPHWALQAIDLAILPGETFGLVGDNGAGKSTLLKVIAGTCKPSTGTVNTTGRIAALLELGAGFHPEESGRDNVYLMGALSGVKPQRMAQYYSAIAEFSELPAEVLARPVKTYSSGMFMRLAFATATAIDPDILIVDEALAVGDMQFQKKSLDRIMGFRERHKTVLFCAHNMYQMRSLCQRVAWLHQGRIQALGPTEDVVTAYESYLRDKESELLKTTDQTAVYKPQTTSLAPVCLRSIQLQDAGGQTVQRLQSFQPVTIQVELESRYPKTLFHVGIAIVRSDKENIYGTGTHFEPQSQPLQGRGEHRVGLEFPRLPLLSGNYWLSVYVLDDSGLQVYDMAESVCPFTVHNLGREVGLVHMPHRWVLA